VSSLLTIGPPAGFVEAMARIVLGACRPWTGWAGRDPGYGATGAAAMG